MPGLLRSFGGFGRVGDRLAEALDLLGVLAVGLGGDRHRLLAELGHQLLDRGAVDLVGVEVLLQALQVLDNRLGGGDFDLFQRGFPAFDVLHGGGDREAFYVVLEVFDGRVELRHG